MELRDWKGDGFGKEEREEGNKGTRLRWGRKDGKCHLHEFPRPHFLTLTSAQDSQGKVGGNVKGDGK